MDKKIYSITELNQLLKMFIEENPYTQGIWITGEISNLKIYQMGKQTYFTLSDGNANINCVMFANSAEKLKFKPENGAKVMAMGKVGFYNKKGSINFQVFFMSKDGLGDQGLAFEKLKKKLDAEGIFAPELKQPIPRYPKKVGLITAFNSAAMWDFITITRKSVPGIKFYVIPATMQGLTSANSVCEALDIANEYQRLDVVVVLRGGGSAEDLASFNNEELVRKIAFSKTPLISAIGHEIDYTLIDLASDLRAPTPTAAAHLIVQSYIKAQADIPVFLDNIYRIVKQKYDEHLNELIQNTEQISETTEYILKENIQKIESLIKRVELANPLHKLRQGFSICRLEKTKAILKSVNEINEGESLQTDMIDGHFISKVTKVLKE
jgi:exodeoxyribonuclease VII large subunit